MYLTTLSSVITAGDHYHPMCFDLPFNGFKHLVLSLTFLFRPCTREYSNMISITGGLSDHDK